jgi:signal peptidase I
VLSGSMRPGLPVGGVVITKRVPITSLKVRDVVVLHRPDKPQELYVHRIVRLSRVGGAISVRTQGDANNAPDPWRVTLRGATAYRVVYAVPLAGYAAVWVHSPQGRRTFLLLGLLMMLGAAAGVLIARRRGAASSDDDADDPSGISDPLGADPDRASAELASCELADCPALVSVSATGSPGDRAGDPEPRHP